MKLNCGPCSPDKKLSSLLVEPDQFQFGTREGSPEKVENPDIVMRRECWEDVRIAIQGQKAARARALDRNWIELPEGIEHMKLSHDPDEQMRGRKSAAWFVERADFPEIVSFVIDKSIGRIFRKQSEYEGLVENDANNASMNLTLRDLNRADEKGRSFADFQEFFLREKFTTRWTAAYVFMIKDPESAEGENAYIPKVRIYTAENICDYIQENGVLTYFLARERMATTSNRFDRHKSGKSEYVYREIELVRSADGRPRQVVERLWKKGKEGKFTATEESQKNVILNERGITSIPVVIDGGIKPEKPMYQALVEKCKEYFRKSAQLENRYFRISNSWLWINRKDSSGGLLRRASDIYAKMTTAASKHARGVGTGGTSAANKMQKPEGKAPKGTNKLVPGHGVLSTENCDVKWLVDEGSGIDKLVTALERCEKQATALGAHFGVDLNFSNISESTFKIQQSGETAHIISHINSSSEALTNIARWIAVFKGVTDQAKIEAINVKVNTKLVEDSEAYSLADIKMLWEIELMTTEEARKGINRIAANLVDLEMEMQEFIMKITQERSGGFVLDDADDPDGDVQITEADLDLRDVALNGAQISSLVNLLEEAARNNLPEKTVIEVIIRSFPGFDREAVIKMLAPLRNFVPSDQAAENAEAA